VPTLKPLHVRTFAGKPLKSFQIYNDPFGGNEVCIELTFLDGDVECVGIGPSRPEVVSTGMFYQSDESHQRLQVPVPIPIFRSTKNEIANDQKILEAGH
jgi:hypothetical protein